MVEELIFSMECAWVMKLQMDMMSREGNGRLGDEVFIEEGNAVPGNQEMLPQGHFHFASLVLNDSIMERGDCCGCG